MASGKKKVKNKYTFAIFKRELPLHLMLLPGLILVAVFSYTPMAGLVIAFQKFIPSKGMFGDQQWVGLGNFSYVFSLPGFNQALKNTIVIAFWKIILGLAVPIVFALMLNEVNRNGFKKNCADCGVSALLFIMGGTGRYFPGYAFPQQWNHQSDHYGAGRKEYFLPGG